jgi:hypothetical protein
MIHLKLLEINVMRRTKQQWFELIQAQQISGLSIIDFCRKQDLPLNDFYTIAVIDSNISALKLILNLPPPVQ